MLKLIMRKLLLALVLSAAVVPCLAGNAERKLKPSRSWTDAKCLALNAVKEAGNQGTRGMQATMAVVINRSKHPNYPNGVCQVILEPKQFSWTNNLTTKQRTSIRKGLVWVVDPTTRRRTGLEAANSPAANLPYMQALTMAQKPDKQLQQVLPAGTLYYHTTKIKPKWSKKLRQVAKIKDHVFYAEKSLVKQ